MAILTGSGCISRPRVATTLPQTRVPMSTRRGMLRGANCAVCIETTSARKTLATVTLLIFRKHSLFDCWRRFHPRRAGIGMKSVVVPHLAGKRWQTLPLHSIQHEEGRPGTWCDLLPTLQHSPQLDHAPPCASRVGRSVASWGPRKDDPPRDAEVSGKQANQISANEPRPRKLRQASGATRSYTWRTACSTAAHARRYGGARPDKRACDPRQEPCTPPRRSGAPCTCWAAGLAATSSSTTCTR